MTLERLQPLLDVLLVLGFCSSRITGFCSVSVFFASQYLTGIARRALIAVFNGNCTARAHSGALVGHNAAAVRSEPDAAAR